MANLHDILWLQADLALAIINENEVVSRSIHLCEPNDHQSGKLAGLRETAKSIMPGQPDPRQVELAVGHALERIVVNPHAKYDRTGTTGYFTACIQSGGT
jgi:hypothetical protein